MLTGDIRLPDRVQLAMQMQVEAERKKRAAVLESEGKLIDSAIVVPRVMLVWNTNYLYNKASF